MNPSSGNLHPTEGYLIAGPWRSCTPGVYHYAPKSHALELLAKMERESWQSLHLPEGTLLLAFSSIYWRESWKYGERAFRYSMLDVGHALAAVAVAAHCLGWQASLEDDPGTEDLARLLGPGRAKPICRRQLQKRSMPMCCWPSLLTAGCISSHCIHRIFLN